LSFRSAAESVLVPKGTKFIVVLRGVCNVLRPDFHRDVCTIDVIGRLLTFPQPFSSSLLPQLLFGMHPHFFLIRVDFEVPNEVKEPCKENLQLCKEQTANDIEYNIHVKSPFLM